MQRVHLQRAILVRTLCAVLAVLSALAASARDVTLGLCLCGATTASAPADTCCPDTADAKGPTQGHAALDGPVRGRCVELEFTGSTTAADATRTAGTVPCPRLPLFTARIVLPVSDSWRDNLVHTADLAPAATVLPAPVPLRI